MDKRLKPLNIHLKVRNVERIASGDETLLCVGSKSLSLFLVTETGVNQVATCPLSSSYDMCHITKKGDFILLSSSNILECYGVQYTKTPAEVKAIITPLAKDEDSISYRQSATYISSCYDEETFKPYFFVSDSDCQMSIITLNSSPSNKEFSIDLLTTESLNSSADLIVSGCKEFWGTKPNDVDCLDALESMVVSNTDVSFIDSKGCRTHKTEELKCDYFVGVMHPTRSNWKEFVAVECKEEQEGEKEGLSSEPTGSSTCDNIVFYMESGGKLIQTRTLVTQREKGNEEGQHISYKRTRGQASTRQAEVMDGKQLSGISDIFIIEDGGKDFIITRRDEGIIMWEKV